MASRLLEADGDLIQTVHPGDDDDEFVIESRFPLDQAVLSENARMRAEGPQDFRDKNGHTFTKVASIPMSLVHQMHQHLGRMPTAKELLALAQHRDFAGLKTMDKTLKQRGDPAPETLLGKDWRPG